MSVRDKQDLLIELLTEELPAKHLEKLSNDFEKILRDTLKTAQFDFTNTQSFATPRRLAVIVEQLNSHQPTQIVERVGPAITAAFDAKQNPTPAGLGFARSCGVEISQLERKMTDKGECLFYRGEKPGQPLQDSLQNILEEVIKLLPMPKTMRWGSHQTPFLRSVQNVLCLYGETVIPVKLFDLVANNQTRGHAFHAPNIITIKNPGTYVTQLEKAKVMVDFQTRLSKINLEIKKLSGKEPANNTEDRKLLHEVAGLVEWPIVLKGNFDEKFLSLPKEVLITSMRENQKCFALFDAKEKLLPHFVMVSNIESKSPETVIHGNERVIRARFSDAYFFYHTDQQTKLTDRLESLKKIIFQEKLGTIFDKATRISQLAAFIAKHIQADENAAQRAGLLAKCDLDTLMVGEFPELQGIIGGYYARHDSESDVIAEAIAQHYMPRFAGDILPHDATACAVALADKIDTLIGIFGLNKKPTGDKDPFGLRRAALGIVRIIIEKKISCNLNAILIQARNLYTQLPHNSYEDVKAFIQERALNWHAENTGDRDTWLAACAHLSASKNDEYNLLDIFYRACALEKFRTSPESASLIAANKRVRNLLLKTEEKINASPNPKLFENDTEKNLMLMIEKMQQKIMLFKNTHDYASILKELSALKNPIDAFFDKVMVMVENNDIRKNRLALLKNLRELFLLVGDVSLLSG